MAITDEGYKAKVAGAGLQELVARRQTQVRQLGQQTLIAGVLTLPVFMVEMGGQTSSWLALFLLITLVMIWPGRSFYTSGLPNQDLVNSVTLWFVPAAMALEFITLIVWLVFGPDPALQFALVASVSVLIVVGLSQGLFAE